jgi:hypothetical protein
MRNKVLFPAPSGPISPKISPCFTAKEQFGVETMDDVFQQLARHAVRKAD